MHQFASGWKQNYYGKGDVTVYRLHRDGQAPENCSPVFGANVTMLLYGDAFWPTYTSGDNANLVATDSMKNFIQRETMNFPGCGLESFCRFLAERFLTRYPHTQGIQVSAVEVPYHGIVDGGPAFVPAGPERATAQLEMRREGEDLRFVEIRSGLAGFRLLRLGGSAFHGFIRDEYTTLPDIRNRPLHMWLDLDWTYLKETAAFGGQVTGRVRQILFDVFHSFESGSIQQVIHQLATKMLTELPALAEVRLEAQNRTWSTVAETGETLGVYTEPQPPYGCLGLTLRR